MITMPEYISTVIKSTASFHDFPNLKTLVQSLFVFTVSMSVSTFSILLFLFSLWADSRAGCQNGQNNFDVAMSTSIKIPQINISSFNRMSCLLHSCLEIASRHIDSVARIHPILRHDFHDIAYILHNCVFEESKNSSLSQCSEALH